VWLVEPIRAANVWLEHLPAIHAFFSFSLFSFLFSLFLHLFILFYSLYYLKYKMDSDYKVETPTADSTPTASQSHKEEPTMEPPQQTNSSSTHKPYKKRNQSKKKNKKPYRPAYLDFIQQEIDDMKQKAVSFCFLFIKKKYTRIIYYLLFFYSDTLMKFKHVKIWKVN
jgi:hypothetical protein